MTRSNIILLIIVLISCSSREIWPGGIITDSGVYEKDDLKIIVTDREYRLDYLMLNLSGDTLIRSRQEFSTIQRWALHLDKSKNLWVFSADVGHACWRHDPLTKKYVRRDYFGPMPTDSLPDEVYQTLKQFHPYNRQE